MRILLVCAAGMSTSLLVQKMRKEVRPEDGEVIIEAVPMEEFEKKISKCDVVLLAPQIFFKKKQFTKIAEDYSIPIGFISSVQYGRLASKEILQNAYSLVKK